MVGKRDDDVKDVYTVINGEKTYMEEEIKNLGTTRQVEAVVKIKLKRQRWSVFNAIQVEEVNETPGSCDEQR